MPIFRRFGDGVSADVACSPRLVFDDDGLTDGSRQLGANDARQDVRGPARREGDDDAHHALELRCGM